MKKPLRIIASLFCLLTLLLSTAACRNVVQPAQSNCDHCPRQSPLGQDIPSCCSAQQQPSAIVSTDLQQPVQLHTAYHHVLSYQIDQPLASPAARAIAPPFAPPRIALRI